MGMSSGMPSISRSARVAAGVLAAAAALAGCRDHPVPVAVLSTADGAHVVTAGRGGLDTADLELASGVTTLVLHSGDIGGALYRAVTPPGAGVLPAAVVSGGHVVVQLRSSGTGGPSVLDVTLSSAVAWTVHEDGGATEATVDMSAGGLAVLDFAAGIARIDATLPRPSGTVVVRLGGGASEFTVHVPAGVPTRVAFDGGAGSATVDGTVHTGIAGGTSYAPNGWDAASDRVDVDNTAGVSTFTLVRY
jgi:hypothetical protein